MAEVITRLNVESSAYESKLKRATASLNAMTTAAEQQGRKIDFANQKNLALVKSLGNMQTVSTTARGQMQELTQAIESATLVYNRMDASMKKGEGGRALSASITQLQGRLQGLKTEMTAVQTSMGKINVGSLGGGMGIGAQFGQGLKSAFSMFGPAALAIGGVTAAIGGLKKVMGDMVQINMQFEQGTAVLASIMGKTTDEITDLTNQAKDLGATTRYTAMQITELQTNLARLGFTQQEILNSTKAVQAFATATGADLGEAANLAGAALRGFGLNATEMERVASVMAVSTTKSALSFEKLATAVPIVAPVAKQFGFTIEDTITLLGKLSDAGMDASSAATATRNIFLKMANDSGKLAQALGKPVHSVEEFGEALKEMREKGMSLNDILSMVGVRSTAAFAVFADNAETLKDFKESITDCGDAMHDMESKQINTLQGSLTILQSAYEGLMLTFSESNGIIKGVVDALTELLGAWTKWRKRNQGGDAAISTYEISDTEVKQRAESVLRGMREATNGRTGQKLYGSDDEIKKKIEDENEAFKKQEEELIKLEKAYREYENTLKAARNSGDVEKAVGIMETNPLKGTKYIGNGKSVEDIYKDAANLRDRMSINDYIISTISPETTPENSNGKGGLGGDKQIELEKARIEMEEKDQIAHLDRMKQTEAEYEAAVYQIKKSALEQILQLYQEDSKEYAQTKAKLSDLDIKHQAAQMRFNTKSPQEQAEEKVAKALEDYSTAINLATMRKEAGLDDEEAYKAKELSARERLFNAYTEAYNLYSDPKYKEAFEEEATQIRELAKAVKALKDTAQEEKQKLTQQKQLDNRILGGLTNTAKKAGWTAEQLGTTGIKTQINAGIDITDDQWKALQDKLNERLQSLGLDPIQIDFETGNIETVVNEAKAEFERLMSDFSSGVGAVSDLVGAMDNLKLIGEDLAEVFSGEKDAWESMMTVFESGIGILNTVISVTEAINTLKELSITLSGRKKAEEAAEAAATVTAASTEASAEGTKAAASLGAAGANAAESSSAAGKAVAGIPIIGPVLAVAAIASVLGAVLSAISQSKSAGKYAQGGIVPGNSFSGDRLTANVNSGELILSRSQQDTIAAQLQGNPMDDLNLSLEVEGTKALIWLNNTNRSLGGDRDFYSRRH